MLISPYLEKLIYSIFKLDIDKIRFVTQFLKKNK